MKQVGQWGTFANDVKNSWLSWLRKAKGNGEAPKDYRNISGLEHVHKGASGCISDQLNEAMEPSLAPRQAGGVRGRGTSVGLLIADEVPMRFSRRKRDPAALRAAFGGLPVHLAFLFVDLVKA